MFQAILYTAPNCSHCKKQYFRGTLPLSMGNCLTSLNGLYLHFGSIKNTLPRCGLSFAWTFYSDHLDPLHFTCQQEWYVGPNMRYPGLWLTTHMVVTIFS